MTQQEQGGFGSWSLSAIAHRYARVRARKGYGASALLAFISFMISLTAQYYAVAFATSHVSNTVTDLFLSNVPRVDVDGIYVYGLFCLVAFIIFLFAVNPKRAPFIGYSLALFIIIRSVFVTLTHLAPYPIATGPDFGAAMTKIFFGGDLFFSGHTGVPFLMALIYWREKWLRYLFIAWSIFFGLIVLLGHLHYSIDVLSAFFITYSIYHLALYLFPWSRELFLEDDPVEVAVV